MIKTIFVLLLFLPASFLWSQTKKDIDCDSLTTQADLNERAKQQFYKADEILDNTYSELIQVLQKEGNTSDSDFRDYIEKIKEKLIIAQKQWIKFRDSFADVWKAKYVGGSMMPMMYFGVLTNLTQMQTKELKLLLKDK